LPPDVDGSYHAPVSAEAPKTTKRRLAAVLGADAVGYSRLMSEDKEATIEALDASQK
jgi:class 3 adenylate cyclase